MISNRQGKQGIRFFVEKLFCLVFESSIICINLEEEGVINKAINGN